MSTSRAPARLVLQQPSGEGLVYTLEQGRSLTVGRDASNAVVLDSPFVSKRHALVSWTARGVRIEDQDSANGLSVNGLTVHAAQLSGGDVIRIGDQTLVFEADGQPASTAPMAGQAPPAPANKALRLLLVAMLTAIVLVGVLTAVYVLVLAPA
jgi:pSer/pThr/pTyr-binding forkhead associated (FHA) protein